MALASGLRLGPYEIVAPLGSGGMGEVYKAKDTRLNRIVAIKVLPSNVSEDPKFKLRFEREARTISSLSHPHICALHDIGHQEDLDFLVMEYLEGETLAKRIAKGPMPLDQVMQYAIQIADALDKAHKQNVVHRDLKPQNIMLTKSGIKLLDFGLAKLHEEEPHGTESQLPTRDQSLTTNGLIVGTLQYMAPEQLEGKEVDERADIFAFGATLYEMATGKKPFVGTSKASLIAAVLSTVPKRLSEIQPTAPPLLDHIIANCLAKNPEDRWQCAHDLSVELKWIAESGFQPAVVVKKSRRNKVYERLAWAAAIAVLATLLILSGTKRAPVSLPISLTVLPPENAMFDSTIAISPDGRRLAFVATDASGKNSIWVRNLDSVSARVLSGTNGAEYPFWSPDGNSLGFFAEGKLKIIGVSGEAPETVCAAVIPRGGTWGSDGVILFSGNGGGALYRVSAKGGSASAVLKSSESTASFRWPHFLPDNRHFLLYVIKENIHESGVFLGSLDSNQTHLLVPADSSAVYTSGHLVFIRAGSLWGQSFDTKNLKITGDAFLISEQPWYNAWVTGYTAFSAGNNVLAYRSGGVQKTQFHWFDRTGKELGIIGDSGVYIEPALSPDEKRISLTALNPKSVDSDIFMLELSRGTSTRFTSDSGIVSCSLWSPDGNRIVYSAFPGKGIYEKLSNGSKGSELLTKINTFAIAEDWSLDGKFITFSSLDLKTFNADLWILPLINDKKPFPYLATEFIENDSQIHSDGKWLAYTSDESGRPEVYVQSFPSPGNKIQISTSGGLTPKWRKDGKELFYISPDKKVMSVTINIDSVIEPSAPTALFQTQIVPTIESRNHYVVTGDGQRFLVNTQLKEIATAPVHVLVNWNGARTSSPL